MIWSQEEKMVGRRSLTRRDFIKAAGVAGGAAIVSGTLSVHGAPATEAAETIVIGDRYAMLRGVSDIHIHAAPDSTPRSVTELDFSRQAKGAGYRSVMFKSIDFSCHDRAYLVREILPGFECFGSLTMNRVHGDKVNVVAAKKAVETSGNLCRCIWMPTSNAAYQHRFLKLKEKGIPVLGDSDQVPPEVVAVMEICAEADMIFATGHSSPEESIVMARKAKEIGVKKFVVTHANSNWWKMTRNQIETVIELGGFIEYCYITNLWGPGTGLPNFTRMNDEEFISYVNIVPERSFVTTDLGQVNMPNPLDGMRRCITAMQKGRVPQSIIDTLVRKNPAMLMGLTE
jgi:hypothetical protein